VKYSNVYEDLLRIELKDITDNEDIAIVDGFSDFALGPGTENSV
jgi:hypothetical protein